MRLKERLPHSRTSCWCGAAKGPSTLVDFQKRKQRLGVVPCEVHVEGRGRHAEDGEEDEDEEVLIFDGLEARNVHASADHHTHRPPSEADEKAQQAHHEALRELASLVEEAGDVLRVGHVNEEAQRGGRQEPHDHRGTETKASRARAKTQMVPTHVCGLTARDAKVQRVASAFRVPPVDTSRVLIFNSSSLND